jgi:two-component system OmpR family sensor kinase
LGRLFWKFFFSIWLAQVAAALAISGGIWFRENIQAKRTENIDVSPSAAFQLESAAATLQFGGIGALRALLQQMERRHVYAIDETSHEILDRQFNPTLVREAKRLLEQQSGPRAVREMQAPDGHTYLLFVPRLQHAMSRLPPGPPGPPGPGHEPPPRRNGPRFPIMPMTLAMLASLVSAAILAWHFSKPIRSLRAAFAAASIGDLDARIGPSMGKRRDELADLGRDFDKMASRLRDLMDGQRRLLHDVSHELRSPLARLHAAIGLARQTPDKIDSSLARIERESIRMEVLVGELLTLSRLEAGVIGGLDEDIGLGELVGDIVEDARFEAQTQNKRVTLEEIPVPHVKGHGELLHRAIENVVRNAVRHTADGSGVTVEIGPDSTYKSIRIAISDSGAGVPAEELTRIFEPFYRSAKAARTTEGHGLGLAIAKRTVEAHGGVIRASNRQEGGLCVEIHLPDHSRY